MKRRNQQRHHRGAGKTMSAAGPITAGCGAYSINFRVGSVRRRMLEALGLAP